MDRYHLSPTTPLADLIKRLDEGTDQDVAHLVMPHSGDIDLSYRPPAGLCRIRPVCGSGLQDAILFDSAGKEKSLLASQFTRQFRVLP